MTQRILLILLALFMTIPDAWAKEKNERWVVYYTNVLPADAFLPFDVIVFDSDSHPALATLRAQHKTLLGYISLGEAEDYRTYYKDIQAQGLLLGADPQWKGHRIIDVRKPEWISYVTDKLIPFVLSQGFDGIMIDTIDSVTDMDANKYKGMQQGAVQLIKAIRTRYPHIKIMLNRGFTILPQIAGDIDMLMAESIYSDLQTGAKNPVIIASQTNQYYVDLLARAKQVSPKLKIYTLDYWNPADKNGVKNIYTIQRKQGYIPYVSTLNLQNIYMEP